MEPRTLKENVYWMGAVEWDKRVSDTLSPLNEGSSCNCFFIRGTEKNVLMDTAGSAHTQILLEQLQGVDTVDYIISHHAQQDHSGLIPDILERYGNCQVICSKQSKPILMSHLGVPGSRIRTVQDSTMLFLGGKTLQVLETPWLPWPDTMCSYLQEDRILFTCNFFSANLATSDLYAYDRVHLYPAAKRFYAEILMPFRPMVKRNLLRLESLEPFMISPGHGPVHYDPAFIMNAYKKWMKDDPENSVVIPYVSIHGSTQRMVDHLVKELTNYNISVRPMDMTVTDQATLASELVDAATLVFGSPTVHLGLHPLIVQTAYMINSLRPKTLHLSVIGSYGWNSRVTDLIKNLVPDLDVEFLDPVLCRGMPLEEDYKAISRLAEEIAEVHVEANLI
ncbi:MAG: FprA family A-type flavoprotein [Chitinispirillaceae bacterium]